MSLFNQTVTEVDSLARSAVAVDQKRVIAAVDEKIYAGFVEHLGRCIYGGLVDYTSSPKAPVSRDGFRQDVAQAIRDLSVPVVRWPGGNFVLSYHWVDGVGARENRPRRPELAWLGEESNWFGTNEFIDWCRHMDLEPYFCLNMGTGTLDEALAWIEYCNSSANTHYANLRRSHGHADPHKVKYWGLGNEVWGDWQVGQMSADAYAEKARQWAKAIKLLDPTVQLVACGRTGIDNWDHTILDRLVDVVDFHSIHLYTASDNYLQNVTAPAAAEAAINTAQSLVDLAAAHHRPRRKPKICVDEWNVWDPERADGTKGAEEQYTLGDALAVASWLNVFVRLAASLGMCNIAQLVNVIAPIMTNESSVYLQTTYHPLRLFSKFMRGNALNLHVDSTLYTGKTGNNDGQYQWLQGNYTIPLLDVSGVQNGSKTYLAVVNRCETENATTKILAAKIEKIHKWLLYHDDVTAYNDFDHPNRVHLKELDVDCDGEVVLHFPKHSFTMVEITYEE